MAHVAAKHRFRDCGSNLLYGFRRCGYSTVMIYRFAEAADILGVSDDTLRRWAESDRFRVARTPDGRAGIEGAALAALAVQQASLPDEGSRASSQRASARNQLRGIVTGVKRDTVMAQVEMVCGPYRVVSLMSREAADSLELALACSPLPPSRQRTWSSR